MAKVILSNGSVYRISADSDISSHPVNDVHTQMDLTNDDFNSVRLNQKDISVSDGVLNTSDAEHNFQNEEELKNYIDSVIKNLNIFLDNDLNSSNPMFNSLQTYRTFLNQFDVSTITFPYEKSWEEYCNDNSITFFHPLQIP
jgi:hypothetical protein